MPPKDRRKILLTDGIDIFVGIYFGKCGIDYGTLEQEGKNCAVNVLPDITHWMELPPLPPNSLDQ
jgi:hypothetical protein